MFEGKGFTRLNALGVNNSRLMFGLGRVNPDNDFVGDKAPFYLQRSVGHTKPPVWYVIMTLSLCKY